MRLPWYSEINILQGILLLHFSTETKSESKISMKRAGHVLHFSNVR